jgi:site-specific recombinase XerD
MKDALQRSEETIDAISAALHRFDIFTRQRSYKKFGPHVARDYKAFLAKQRNARTGKLLSKATQRGELQILKAFFQWLHGRPGYRSCFALTDANYFNMTHNDVASALASRPRPCPSLAMVNQVLSAMPSGTAIEKRDRALIAFTIITAARVDAIRTFKIRDVELAQGASTTMSVTSIRSGGSRSRPTSCRSAARRRASFEIG